MDDGRILSTVKQKNKLGENTGEGEHLVQVYNQRDAFISVNTERLRQGETTGNIQEEEGRLPETFKKPDLSWMIPRYISK